jgi:hypothetical protein
LALCSLWEDNGSVWSPRLKSCHAEMLYYYPPPPHNNSTTMLRYYFNNSNNNNNNNNNNNMPPLCYINISFIFLRLQYSGSALLAHTEASFIGYGAGGKEKAAVRQSLEIPEENTRNPTKNSRNRQRFSPGTSYTQGHVWFMTAVTVTRIAQTHIQVSYQPPGGEGLTNTHHATYFLQGNNKPLDSRLQSIFTVTKYKRFNVIRRRWL